MEHLPQAESARNQLVIIVKVTERGSVAKGIVNRKEMGTEGKPTRKRIARDLVMMNTTDQAIGLIQESEIATRTRRKRQKRKKTHIVLPGIIVIRKEMIRGGAERVRMEVSGGKRRRHRLGNGKM